MLSLGTEILIAAASSIIFGSILCFTALKLKSVSQGSFVISSIHAISMIFLTSKVIFVECWDSDHIKCHFDSPISSEFQQAILCFSFGYFLVDSIVVLWLAPDVSASLHHVSILVGLVAAIFSGEFTASVEGVRFQYSGSSGYPLAVFLFAAEISAPFLNAFMSGLTAGTSLDIAARGLFAVTFLVSRIIICPILTYRFVVNCPNAHAIPKAVCVIVMCISVYWAKAIIKEIISTVSGMIHLRSKGQ